METKRKCKCRKHNLPRVGRVVIRCAEHRGKPSKSGRLLCYWNDDGIVRREHPDAEVPTAAHRPSKRARARRTYEGFVYFAQLGGVIKIGYSKHPEWRSNDLNAELLVSVPGDRELEKSLHREFSELRERGEWFRAEASLLERIEELSA